MTVSATARPVSGGRVAGLKQAPAGKRRDGGRSRCSRLPVDHLLPKEVLSKLRQHAVSTDKITAKSVTDLDRRLAIAAQYGVSKRRLRTYLERVHCTHKGKSRSAAGSQHCTISSSDGSNRRMQAHRRRQASVAAILDETFGQLARCSPDLWERRAYLMLVGLVYERLATNEVEISTDELIALAKVLAENRRAEARVSQTQRAQTAEETSDPCTGELPDRFTDVVRQIYGTNLQTHDAQNTGKECAL